MPKSPESSVKTQGVKATVQPTKQAIVTPSTTEVGGTPNIHYNRLTSYYLLRAKFSETPKSYYVHIFAKQLDKDLDAADVYEEYHPLMAIGRAIVEMRRVYSMAKIEDISISERTFKNR